MEFYYELQIKRKNEQLVMKDNKLIQGNFENKG